MTTRGRPLMLVGVALALVIVACTQAGGTGTPGPTGGATHGAIESASPSPPPSPSPTGSPGPTPTPAESAAATPTATPAPLPVAALDVAGITIAGALGSYEIDGRGSNSPWLPFAGLPGVSVTSATVLRLHFADDVGIGQVAALLAAADDPSGAIAQGAATSAPGPGAIAVTVGPLPRGRWVLQVRLFRADGRGDGVTYWAVTVT